MAEFSLLEVVEVLAILEFRFVHFAVGFSTRVIFPHTLLVFSFIEV